MQLYLATLRPPPFRMMHRNVIGETMIKSKLFRLARGNIRSLMAKNVFLKLGLDFTRPTHVYAEVTNKCNSRCKMCRQWRTTVSSTELSAFIWKQALHSLSCFSPDCKVCFAGGEALLKDDFFDILRYCQESNILFGLTTNGILLNDDVIRKLFSCNPFNVNISLDSLDEDVYRTIRGVDGLKTVLSNIEKLMELRESVGNSTVINLKTMVTRENIQNLETIVEYSKGKRFSGLTFQPVIKTTTESLEMFQVDRGALGMVVERLIEMKRHGYPLILNSEGHMRHWAAYFEETINSNKKSCPVPLRSMYILSNGEKNRTKRKLIPYSGESWFRK